MPNPARRATAGGVGKTDGDRKGSWRRGRARELSRCWCTASGRAGLSNSGRDHARPAADSRCVGPEPKHRASRSDSRRGGISIVELSGGCMAKRRKRKYSRGTGSEVQREMHRYKRGKAKSGRSGKGGKVKSRKQAIAIALSKARKKGKKVPKSKK